MKSIITLAIEHGETTDPLQAFIELAYGLPECAEGLESLSIIDHTLKVDVEHVTVKELEALLEPVGFNAESLITGGHFD